MAQTRREHGEQRELVVSVGNARDAQKRTGARQGRQAGKAATPAADSSRLLGDGRAMRGSPGVRGCCTPRVLRFEELAIAPSLGTAIAIHRDLANERGLEDRPNEHSGASEPRCHQKANPNPNALLKGVQRFGHAS